MVEENVFLLVKMFENTLTLTVPHNLQKRNSKKSKVNDESVLLNM